MTEEHYLQKIRECLERRLGRAGGRMFNLLTNAERDELVTKHGPEMVAVIRAHANDADWTPSPTEPEAA